MDRNDQILFGTLCVALIAIVLSAAASSSSSPTVAAWAQTFGVVGAIIGSAKIAQWQYAKAKSDEAARAVETDERRLSDIRRLVFKVQIFVNDLPSWVFMGENGKIATSDIRPEQATVLSWLLYESDFSKLDDFTMVNILADLRARMMRISFLLNEEPKGVVPSNWEQANRRAAGNIALDAKRDCDDFLRYTEDYKLRGGPPRTATRFVDDAEPAIHEARELFDSNWSTLGGRMHAIIRRARSRISSESAEPD